MRDAVSSALGVKNLSEVGELTKAQQKQAASAIQAASASSKLGAAQTMTTMATAGLTSASTMATTAFNGLKAACVAHPFMAIAAAVLAAVAVAIVAVAAVMLLKMRVPSTEFTRGGKGRATQKKRV